MKKACHYTNQKRNPMHTKLNINLPKINYEYANNEVHISTLEKPAITGQLFNINLVFECLFQNKVQIKIIYVLM